MSDFERGAGTDAEELFKLRKIAAYVPAKIWIKAKEDAGFGETIKPQAVDAVAEVYSRPGCPFNYCMNVGLCRPDGRCVYE